MEKKRRGKGEKREILISRLGVVKDGEKKSRARYGKNGARTTKNRASASNDSSHEKKNHGG